MIIQQAAFAKGMPFLKGGLHCHTNRSDGLGSPEATVRHYGHLGYDFLAITDHRQYNFVNYAPESGVLILPGMEADRFLDGPGRPCCHVVALGPEEGNGYTHGQRVRYEHTGDLLGCQQIIDDILAAGNLPILAHPVWSANDPWEVAQLRGFHLMEVCNTGAEREWGTRDAGLHWDLLLHKGRRIYGVASDDGHNLGENGQGFVRVAAEKNVASILDALSKGEFYSSCGPEIYDFYIDGEYACIHCSPVSTICLRNFSTPHRQIHGQGLNGGQIKLRDCCQDYIRMEITDDRGRRAWTNPIFLSDLKK